MKPIRGARPGRTHTADTTSWRWQDAAACRGEDLTLFFGRDGERQPERELREAAAKEICAACPAQRGCLDHAISRPEKYGMWGGFTADERHTERRNRMRGRAPRYTPPPPPKEPEPPKLLPPQESIRMITELLNNGLTAQQISDKSGVSIRVLARLREEAPPKAVFRATEDKLRTAHQALIGPQEHAEVA